MGPVSFYGIGILPFFSDVLQLFQPAFFDIANWHTPLETSGEKILSIKFFSRSLVNVNLLYRLILVSCFMPRDTRF